MKVINVDERIKKAIVNSTMEFFKVPKELFTKHKECKKYYQPFLKELFRYFKKLHSRVN